jgi:hypothetical protein
MWGREADSPTRQPSFPPPLPLLVGPLEQICLPRLAQISDYASNLPRDAAGILAGFGGIVGPPGR